MIEGVMLIPRTNQNTPHYRFTILLKSEHISPMAGDHARGLAGNFPVSPLLGGVLRRERGA